MYSKIRCVNIPCYGMRRGLIRPVAMATESQDAAPTAASLVEPEVEEVH